MEPLSDMGPIIVFFLALTMIGAIMPCFDAYLPKEFISNNQWIKPVTQWGVALILAILQFFWESHRRNHDK
jgi:hypothetical protein